MKIKNQKGFSLMEGLFLLLIIGLISIAAWFVWSSRENSSKPVTSNSTASSKTYDKKTAFTSNKDFDEIKVNDKKIIFVKPNGWTAEESLIQKYDEFETGGVTFTCSGCIETKQNPNHSAMSFHVGYIYYSKTPTEPYLKSKSSGSSKLKTLKVGGVDGVQYIFNPGEYGNSLITDAIYNNLQVTISAPLQETDYLSEPYLSHYNQVVGSIKFE